MYLTKAQRIAMISKKMRKAEQQRAARLAIIPSRIYPAQDAGYYRTLRKIAVHSQDELARQLAAVKPVVKPEIGLEPKASTKTIQIANRKK